jgi:hypothetical protein
VTSWHSVHVHYHDDPVPLILNGVRPLFHRLTGSVDAAYYIRHWRQGPHLRLNIRCDDETFERTVMPAVHDVVGGFLAAHPSTRDLDPETHLPMHQRLAELEQQTGPLMPWQPDNSIHVAGHDQRVTVHGGRAMAELADDFYSDTTEIAFEMTERASSGSARLAAGFDLMVTAAHALSGVGITGGYISYRSHSEAFLWTFPEGAGLRPAWDEHYQRHSATLHARLKRVVAALDGSSPPEFPASTWAEALEPYRSRAARLIEQGHFVMPQGDAQAESTLGQASPFHRAGYANPLWQEVQQSAGFQVYRLMLNYTYLHLSRLGVTPAERFLLCHLTANAVEDLYSVSALGLVTRQAGEPMPGAR